MSSLVTFTLNPAIDESTSIAVVSADRKLRCREALSHPGGGGINVARAIRRLGGEATAVFPAGGATGDLLEALLAGEGVPRERIPIAGSTRQNWNVFEESTGREYRFCMPGPVLRPEEWRRCFDRLREWARGASFVVGSGSLPPGASPDAYARAAEAAEEAGARFVLDASGDALRAALERGLFLVKPSLFEFRELTATGPEVPLEQAGRSLVSSGKCEVLVVSLGAGGAFWMDRSGWEMVPSPSVSAVSSIGAGDCLVGGIVLALLRGSSVADAVRLGVAAGSAAVLNPGTELCHREDAERLAGEFDGARFGT